MMVNYPKIIKEFPYRRFIYAFFAANILLFVLSFFESQRFMSQFEGNIVIISFVLYITTFVLTLVAYGILFYYVEKKRKWAFIFLEIILITAAFEILLDLGLLGFLKITNPIAYELAAGKLNMFELVVRKTVSMLVYGYAAFYIFSYWKTYKK